MVKAFNTGQRFKFPDKHEIYTFVSVRVEGLHMVITYLDENDKQQETRLYELMDLIHV